MRLLIAAEECDKIIRQYYKEIYNYCFAHLGYNKHSAEDCAQDVFVTFYSKHEKLQPDQIRLWLYRAADLTIKAFLRKNGNTVSIEDVPEVQEIADESAVIESRGSPLDDLDDEERLIIETYYSTDYGSRTSAAKRLGMSLPALYQKVHKIKQKLKGGNNKQ